MKRTPLIAVIALTVLLGAPQRAAAIAILAEGMITPQTISPAPPTFVGYGNHYFIPDTAGNSADLGLHNVWVVPAGGGAPVVFSTGNQEILLGGLFLPDTEFWGIQRGKYLTTGRYPDFAPDSEGRIFTYAPDGSRGLFAAVPGARLSQPAIAPEGFGALGGNLIASASASFDNSPGSIFVVAPEGTASVLAGALPAASSPFGLAFAPAGFGTVGGQLLVSDSRSGAIVAVASDGSAAPFTSVVLAAGQTGLRQMAFSPAGFIDGFGELLFVAVSGSIGGGGTLGDVLALDLAGDLVASLRDDLGLTKFDPRGLLFAADGNLLISDASDPIWIATAGDFRREAAEPPSLALCALALALLVAMRRAGVAGSGTNSTIGVIVPVKAPVSAA